MNNKKIRIIVQRITTFIITFIFWVGFLTLLNILLDVFGF